MYWRAWEALRFDRAYDGMGGQRPIFYTAYSRYAEDNGISGTEFVIFHKLMCAIDAEWLEHVAQRQKEAEKS